MNTTNMSALAVVPSASRSLSAVYSSSSPTPGYSPKNASICEAAYVGAYAGMYAGRDIANTPPSAYAADSVTALVWAQAIDTAVAAVIGSATPVTQLQIDLTREKSYGAFSGRQMIGQNDFSGEPEAVAAFIAAGAFTFGMYGGTPSPTPAGLPTDTGLGAILVFQPGGTYSATNPQPSNVFTDATVLFTALQTLGSQATVRIDSTFSASGVAIIPGNLGTINLGYGVTFEPASTDFDTNNNAITGPADTLEIQPGTTLVGFRGIRGPLEIQAQCTAGPAIIMTAGDAYTLTDGAALVLLPASTGPLVQCAPNESGAASTSATFTLTTDGLVSLQSQAVGIPLFGLGYAATLGGTITPSSMTVFASRTLSVQGLVFGGTGSVYFNFDGSCSPLFAGPNQPHSSAPSPSSGPPVSTGVTIVNALQSQIPQDRLVFNPTFSTNTRWAAYGPVCSTWDQVMAWVNCQNNAITDITIALSSGTAYTLTATTPGQPYVLSGITLHGSAAGAGPLVLADGVVLQDVAGVTDGLSVQAVAATTTPFTFSKPGASFFVDGGASVSFVANPASGAVNGLVPAISVTGALSPLSLAITDGATLQNTNATAALVQLADAKAVANVLASNGTTVGGAVLSGLVFSGPVGSQLTLERDATVSRPSLTSFLGTFNDIRLSLGANVLPASGLASAAPTTALVGDRYYATDLQTLCICIAPGRWASSNVTTGTAATLPKVGLLGQLYYATDTLLLSVWNGAAWAPLSGEATIGLAAALPSVGAPGQIYFETDAKQFMVWTGSAWVPLITTATLGAASAIPTSGIPGQLYFATDTGRLSVWNGTAWAPLTTTVLFGTTAAMPTAGVPGQLYFATDTNQLTLWSGTVWTPAMVAVAAGAAAAIPKAGVPGQLYFANDTNQLSAWSGTSWATLATTAATGVAAAIPKAGVLGQLFFATDTSRMSVWNGLAWAPLTTTAATGTAAALPSTGVLGQHYFATDTKQLSVWNGVAWSPLTSPQTQVVFDPTGLLAAQPAGYVPVCSTWAQLTAWIQLNQGTVTDVTIALATLTSYTVTPTTPGQAFNFAGITLHGSPWPNDGTLVLDDGLVLQDLAGVTDGLHLQVAASTTVPFTFSKEGPRFSLDRAANMSFLENHDLPVAPSVPDTASAPVKVSKAASHKGHSTHKKVPTKHKAHASADAATADPPAVGAPVQAQPPQQTQSGPPRYGSVPAMVVHADALHFTLSITNGAYLMNADGSSALIALSDPTSSLTVNATAAAWQPTFSGLVFSGVPGSELVIARDATVIAPSMDSFAGKYDDERLSMAASLLPSTGKSAKLPANALVGETYYASDLHALCVCVAPGQWESTNSATGDSSDMPRKAVLGQLFYATDLNVLSIWNGSTWIPMGLMSGLAADLPDTAAQGQMYLQADANKLSVFNNGQWMSTKLHASP